MTKELRKTIAALLVAHDEVEEARRVAVSQVQTAESVGVTTVLAAEKCEAAEATTVRTAAKFIISLLTLLYTDDCFASVASNGCVSVSTLYAFVSCVHKVYSWAERVRCVECCAPAETACVGYEAAREVACTATVLA